MSEQTVKCPICGEPYVFYSHYAGDQSACPGCRAKARRRTNWERHAVSLGKGLRSRIQVHNG